MDNGKREFRGRAGGASKPKEANAGRLNPEDEETAEEFVQDAMYRAYNYTPLDKGDRGQEPNG